MDHRVWEKIDLERRHPGEGLKARRPDDRICRVTDLLSEMAAAKEPLSVLQILRQRSARFIDFAYLAILCRPPDDVGRQSYEQVLAQGKMSPIMVLGSLRYSPEGRTVNRRIYGLWPLYWAERISRWNQGLWGQLLTLPLTFLGLPWLHESRRLSKKFTQQEGASP